MFQAVNHRVNPLKSQHVNLLRDLPFNRADNPVLVPVLSQEVNQVVSLLVSQSADRLLNRADDQLFSQQRHLLFITLELPPQCLSS